MKIPAVWTNILIHTGIILVLIDLSFSLFQVYNLSSVREKAGNLIVLNPNLEASIVDSFLTG